MTFYTVFPEISDIYFFRAPTRHVFGTSRIFPNTLYVEIMLGGRAYYDGAEYQRGTVFCHTAGQSTLHDFPKGKPYRVLMLRFLRYNKKRWNFPHISHWRHMESLDSFVHDALEDSSSGVAREILSAYLFTTLQLNLQPKTEPGKKPKILRELFNVKRELGRFDREINWSDFAQSYANYNPQYLRKLFQNQLGESPARYRLRVQIEAACRLLRENAPTTIAEIASKTGFRNIETFYRAFKRLMNCTPLQYRQKQEVAPAAGADPASS